MAQTLYLMRHGQAEAIGPGGVDAERSLTDAGVHQLRLQAQAMARAGLRPAHILTSPYRRARQTAALVAEALDGAAEVEVETLIRSGCSFADVAEVLERHAELPSLLLVGHQPDLGNTLGTLTGATAVVRPGTLAVVDLQRPRPHSAYLVGLYHPDVLMRLGAS